MKLVKRILAICGIIFLVAMYASTLVFAIIGNPKTMGMFKASIFATFIIPVLIWAYTFIYKLIKDRFQDDGAQDEDESSR